MVGFGFSFFVFCVDGHIVHVHSKVSARDLRSEQGVHHGLEGRWRIGEAKEHHSGFEQSFISGKSHLPLVPLLYFDCIVAPLDIDLGEEGAPPEAVYLLWN
jgi:hypothetical protein